MKIRIASTLLALMLPLAAQEPAANTEAIFYKAFYLEKGQKDFANAMVLYQQFLDLAPDHKLAKEAAVQQYGLLGTTGKTKERDAFKAKYEKLLGNAAPVPAAGDRPAGGGGDAPRGRGEGQGRPGAGDMQARMAELEKQLAKAKEEGNTEEAKKLEEQITRMKQMAQRGGAGGQGRPAMLPTKKLADMTAEEMTAFKGSLPQMADRIERMKERIGEEQAKKASTSLDAIKKALDANKLDDAQKALDELRAAMPAGRRGGGGGGGGNNGGGGGNNGGGGRGGIR